MTNTALVNFVMGSRLLYGMARRKLLPAALGRVHDGRSTPHVAIFLILGITMVLTLTLGRPRSPAPPASCCSSCSSSSTSRWSCSSCGGTRSRGPSCAVPLFVPIVGALLTVALALAVKPKALWSFAILAPAGIVLYLLYQVVRWFRSRGVQAEG